MYIHEVPVGSKVSLYTDFTKRSIYRVKKDYTLEAWVVAGKDSPKKDCVLVGWKDKEPTPSAHTLDEFKAHCTPPTTPVPSDYVQLLWIVSDTEIAGVVSGSTSIVKSAGMFCRGCGDWCPYVVANRPSGNFVCFGCRQGFIPSAW